MPFACNPCVRSARMGVCSHLTQLAQLSGHVQTQARDEALEREGKRPHRRSPEGLASLAFRNVGVSLGGPCPGTQVWTLASFMLHPPELSCTASRQTILQSFPQQARHGPCPGTQVHPQISPSWVDAQPTRAVKHCFKAKDTAVPFNKGGRLPGRALSRHPGAPRIDGCWLTFVTRLATCLVAHVAQPMRPACTACPGATTGRPGDDAPAVCLSCGVVVQVLHSCKALHGNLVLEGPTKAIYVGEPLSLMLLARSETRLPGRCLAQLQLLRAACCAATHVFLSIRAALVNSSFLRSRKAQPLPQAPEAQRFVCARQAGEAVMQSVLRGQEARWFRGECVWAPQQLEAELQAGLHVLVQADVSVLQPLRCVSLPCSLCARRSVQLQARTVHAGAG